MRGKKALALMAAACLGTGLASADCNYDDGWNADRGTTRVEGQQQDVVRVRMTDQMTFEPRTVRIRPGQTVRWENNSDLHHTVTADPGQAIDERNVMLPAGASPFDSGRITAGQSFTQTFHTPGTYRYFCKVHESMGMVGEIIVSDD